MFYSSYPNPIRFITAKASETIQCSSTVHITEVLWVHSLGLCSRLPAFLTVLLVSCQHHSLPPPPISAFHSAEGMNAGGYGNLLMSIEQPQGEYGVTISFLNLVMTLVRVSAFGERESHNAEGEGGRGSVNFQIYRLGAE